MLGDRYRLVRLAPLLVHLGAQVPLDLLDLSGHEISSLGLRSLEKKRWAACVHHLSAAGLPLVPSCVLPIVESQPEASLIELSSVADYLMKEHTEEPVFAKPLLADLKPEEAESWNAVDFSVVERVIEGAGMFSELMGAGQWYATRLSFCAACSDLPLLLLVQGGRNHPHSVSGHRYGSRGAQRKESRAVHSSDGAPAGQPRRRVGRG